MRTDYGREIGYETLRSDFKSYQKQTPKGVSLAKKRNSIYLQFKTPGNKRDQYSCNCSFTIDGMIDAVKKAYQVAEALNRLTSETEFWEWYDKNIRESAQIKDDLITFQTAIAKVEDDFWI